MYRSQYTKAENCIIQKNNSHSIYVDTAYSDIITDAIFEIHYQINSYNDDFFTLYFNEDGFVEMIKSLYKWLSSKKSRSCWMKLYNKINKENVQILF